MRTYTYYMATSALIGSSSFATSGQRIDFTSFYASQSNIGGPNAASGIINLQVSNVNEPPMFVTAGSAIVNTNGSYMFNILTAGYEWMRIQYVGGGSSTTGIMTSILQSKGA